MIDATNTAVEATRQDRFVERGLPLLPPQVVKELYTLDNRRAALYILLDLALISLAMLVALRVWQWPVTLLALVVIGARQHALAVLMHEASHFRLFTDRRLNDVVGRLIGYSLGLSMLTYRGFHVRHHNHLFDARDPDLPLYAPYPRSRGYLVQKVLKDLFALTLFKNVQYMVAGIASTKRPEGVAAPKIEASAPEVAAARKRDRRGLLMFQAAVLAAVVGAGVLPYYLLFWTLPLFTVVQVLLRVRAIADHGAARVGDPRLPIARTMKPGPLVRFFIIPHHEHYHLEHHLWPGIPHYNLPRAHRLLVEAGVYDGTEVPRQFREVLRAATSS